MGATPFPLGSGGCTPIQMEPLTEVYASSSNKRPREEDGPGAPSNDVTRAPCAAVKTEAGPSTSTSTLPALLVPVPSLSHEPATKWHADAPAAPEATPSTDLPPGDAPAPPIGTCSVTTGACAMKMQRM